MTLEFSNIFDAVTDNHEKSNELQTRADLMIAIRDIITSKKWSQKQAGINMGLTQPRVSDLVNGRIEKFSIDKLMSCLYRLGFRFKPLYRNNTLTIGVEHIND
jgi:predicted XRE-type DNA-binding protein